MQPIHYDLLQKWTGNRTAGRVTLLNSLPKTIGLAWDSLKYPLMLLVQRLGPVIYTDKINTSLLLFYYHDYIFIFQLKSCAIMNIKCRRILAEVYMYNRINMYLAGMSCLFSETVLSNNTELSNRIVWVSNMFFKWKKMDNVYTFSHNFFSHFTWTYINNLYVKEFCFVIHIMCVLWTHH